jgi:phosphatidylinositol dimannoside acyltransferase
VPDLRGRLTDLGFAAGWGAVKALPEPLAARAFRLAADRSVARNGPGVRQLRRNLARVSPLRGAELEELVGAGLRSYARYWLETFRLPKMDQARVAANAHSQTIGEHHMDAAMAAGKGMILALPHTGNWDVAGIYLMDRYQMPFATVAERLKPESLYDRFVAYRQSLGMEVLPLTGGSRPVTEVLSERLRSGGIVCLVGDRDITRSGVEVDFFGEPAKLPPGPALLAATTGATLLSVGLWFTPDGGWAQHVGPPIEPSPGRLNVRVREATQLLADAFAGYIAAHPADWHMLQRFWTADLADVADRATPSSPAHLTVVPDLEG